MKLAEASKIFGKKFASGASITKNPMEKDQIEVSLIPEIKELAIPGSTFPSALMHLIQVNSACAEVLELGGRRLSIEGCPIAQGLQRYNLLRSQLVLLVSVGCVNSVQVLCRCRGTLWIRLRS